MPLQFSLNTWADVEPYFTQLQDAQIDAKEALEQWLLNLSELEAALSEDACWRQIKMTCDTENKTLEESFNYFCLEIQPLIQQQMDVLNKKLLSSPALPLLDQNKYHTYLRNIQKTVSLFNEQNTGLEAQMAVLQQQYGQITGAMQVEINGKEYTLQQAGRFLENPDRAVREEVYIKIQQRRLQDRDKLNELFDSLLGLRKQIAQNAGFDNYTAYRFKELGRFDYGVEQCFQFHDAVKQHIVPMVKDIYMLRKQKLGLDELRPYDIDAEPAGITPLRPFANGDDLLDRSVAIFNKLDPYFGSCLSHMRSIGHFDVDSRKGKAPGGYNCPLAESGAPFIFMNAAGKMDDVTTMLHEGGHAVHSYLAHPLALTGFKEYPMEIAEVASMAMELFTMDHWDILFDNAEELRRAKLHQLERVITIFPWIATIDKFQHWLYANPGHSVEERTEAWLAVQNEFDSGAIDHRGLEAYRANAWQRQLHLFEVPFYYIEYGIAQLGAIGLWMQYKNNPQTALANYRNALSLGATKTLPELYKAAGLEFDFSAAKIKEPLHFVFEEWKKLAKA